MRRIEPSKSWKAKHFADDNIDIIMMISQSFEASNLNLPHYDLFPTDTDNTIIMRHRLQYHRSSRMHLSSKCDNTDVITFWEFDLLMRNQWQLGFALFCISNFTQSILSVPFDLVAVVVLISEV